MAMTLYPTSIYDNSGNKLLWQVSAERQATISVTDGGATVSGGDQFSAVYGYQGSGTFLGFSTTPGSTTPEYAPGDTFTAAYNLNLYIVESGGTVEKTLTVGYGERTLFRGSASSNLQKALKCQGKVMSDDVIINIQ